MLTVLQVFTQARSVDPDLRMPLLYVGKPYHSPSILTIL